ncbi:MAG: hypothetical protein ACJ8AO_11175 [Gemmatimonadaceae bacterium]
MSALARTESDELRPAFDALDVGDELEAADECDARAEVSTDDASCERLRRRAERHRERARTIARLIGVGYAEQEWYPASAILAPLPWRTVRAEGGPFGGLVLRVDDPPRPFWVARLGDGYYVHYLISLQPPALPGDGETLGGYRWDAQRRRLTWWALRGRAEAPAAAGHGTQ